VEGGASFVGVYGHAMTATAPGHALLATGADAGRTGIVDNEWMERSPWRRVHADDDPQLGTSPINLRATTFAESLTTATGRRARRGVAPPGCLRWRSRAVQGCSWRGGIRRPWSGTPRPGVSGNHRRTMEGFRRGPRASIHGCRSERIGAPRPMRKSSPASADP